MKSEMADKQTHSSFDIQMQRCVAFVLNHEGGYQTIRSDPGNWTGGKVGKGRLVGTKYGISAASFPSVDIKSLTLAQAARIYERNYYLPARCDKMPYPIALVFFDACVNQGRGWATRDLQRLLKVKADGMVGPITIGAILKSPLKKLVQAFLVRRLQRYTKINNSAWEVVWFRRIIDLADEVLEESLYVGDAG